ncbi:MAG TPA: hypothetical protein VM425_08660 [Myxococcota bacterium]|nr:hypothetical protein [Myxococcota bacterium]
MSLSLSAGCGGGGGPVDGGPDFDWPACDEISATVSLAAKAAYFDKVSRERHLAGDGLLRNINLSENLESVENWHHVENTILWSGMYIASQAFRYAVTRESVAQENAKTVVAALRQLTDVTGVRGLYGRSFAKPGVSYNYDGSGTTSWTASPDANHIGWWYRNDVSKDGYDGLMFGYAAAMEHFDDQQLLTDIRRLLTEIGDHLTANGLQIIGADGHVTEHGALYHSAWDDFPGFNALLASSFIKTVQTATGDQGLDDFYYGCLMRTRQGVDCPDIETSDIGSYIDSMEDMLYLFLPNCKQNYDNFDMCYQAIYPLLRREQDPGLRARLLGVLRNNMFHSDDPDTQSIDPLGNSFFTFAYAALTGDGPDDDPLLGPAVNRAVCILKNFPQEKFDRHIPQGTQPEVCRSRLDEPVATEPIPLSEYAFDNYLWRLDFFKIQDERPENRRLVYSPEDYLVAYWLGRYHGLIDPDL